MRVLFAPSVAACACATALVLPVLSPAAATAATRPAAASTAAGATRTVALVPLPGPDASRTLGTPVPQGIASRTVKPFSLLGITWADGTAGLHGTVQVRTRQTATHRWSGWQGLETGDDAPDRDAAERAGGRVRGGTAPLWVGAADGVQVRVTPQAPPRGRAGVQTALPKGLRVDMVDPGPAAAAPRAAAPDGWNPADRSAKDMVDTTAWQADTYGPAAATVNAAHTAPRPRITTRAGWGANESLRERAFVYTGSVKAVFVHHTGTGNSYTCAQAPSLIRGIYRYHVISEGWRDIGYNFLVDRCGTIYEGRAGGVARAVLGAHTLGFNTDSTGVAVIGTFTRTNPAAAAVRAVEHLAAWKLGLTGANANSTTTLTSRGSNKYRSGAKVKFHRIAGHRDGFVTECPGAKLYGQLPAIRKAAAKLQGR